VLRGGVRHLSLKALPKPLAIQSLDSVSRFSLSIQSRDSVSRFSLAIQCGIVISLEACSTLRAAMPADGHAFGDHGSPSPTGARCLEGEDGQERAPTRLGNRLRAVVMLEPVGRLPVLVSDRVVLTHQLEGSGVLEVPALALHRLLRVGAQLDRLLAALPPVLAALPPVLAATDPPVRRLQRAFCLAIPAGDTRWRYPLAIPAKSDDARAVCKRGERLPTPVYPRLLSGGRERLPRPIRARDPPRPAVRCPPERDRLDPSRSVPLRPALGRDQRTAIRPLFERTRKPVSRVAPLSDGLVVRRLGCQTAWLSDGL
jgi:hypothetical protein